MTQAFRKIFNVIALDTALRGAALKLYLVLNALADLQTRQVIIYIKTLAEKAGISPRHVRRCLAVLIDLGLVERVLRKSKHDPRMNCASLFTVHDIDAERYGGFLDVLFQDCQNSQHLLTNMSVPTDTDGRQKIKEGFEKDSLKENNNNFNEDISQKEKNIKKFESVEPVLEAKEKSTDKMNTSVNASKDISDVFLETVDYLFKNTGRTRLYDSELNILRKLSHETDLPRVKKLLEKLIDEAVERFTRKGKPLKNVTINYLAKALENQMNQKKAQMDSQEKDSQTQKKTLKHTQNTALKKTEKTQSDTETEIKPELTMSVEEAEKVINNYGQEKEQTNFLPTALLEVFEKIKSEQIKRTEEFFTQQNAEFDRAEETGEPAHEIEFKHLTLEDYLHIKFPEAENEELHRDMMGKTHETYNDFPQGWLLEDAFKIDFACAMCEDPSSCSIPKDYKQGLKKRPSAVMLFNENSKKFLGTRSEGCVKCKYGVLGKTRREMELQSRIKNSGLAAMQVNQTFDAFDHQDATPEVVVAKAQAILAAKNKTNLILAGKPGTGKTHLASAIALEAMKNGNQAIFKSLPELLDQICYAYQNNADPYGLMLKYKRVPCLILDDWGKEKTTDARMDYLFQIIDYRYRNGLQTILTTNAFNAEGLKNHWNADKIEPLVSRILENGQWVTIYDSENHRLKNSPKPEVLEQKTQEEAVSSEVPIIPEAKDFQECHEPAIEVPEKTSSAAVPIDEADKVENFSEPGNSSGFAAPSVPKVEIPTNESEKSFGEPRKISQIFSCSQAGKEEVKPSRELWQKIAESAEYKAMSESEKINKQREFYLKTPEYEALSPYKKESVQIYFSRMFLEAEQREALFAQFTQQANGSGNVISVPQYDDGLEDDDNELKL